MDYGNGRNAVADNTDIIQVTPSDTIQTGAFIRVAGTFKPGRKLRCSGGHSILAVSIPNRAGSVWLL